MTLKHKVKDDFHLHYENLTLVPVFPPNPIIVCQQVYYYSQCTTISSSAAEISRPYFLASFSPDTVYGLSEASNNWMHKSRWVYEKCIYKETIRICFINTYLSLCVCLGGNDKLCFSSPTPKPHSSNSIISFPTECIKVHSHVLSQTILFGLWIRRFSHFALFVFILVFTDLPSPKKKQQL